MSNLGGYENAKRVHHRSQYKYPVEELKKCIGNVSSLEKYNARSICSSSFNTSFEMKFPFYSHIWYLLNLEMWNRCDVRKPILDTEYI